MVVLFCLMLFVIVCCFMADVDVVVRGVVSLFVLWFAFVLCLLFC